jgi:hypothetical protein
MALFPYSGRRHRWHGFRHHRWHPHDDDDSGPPFPPLPFNLEAESGGVEPEWEGEEEFRRSRRPRLSSYQYSREFDQPGEGEIESGRQTGRWVRCERGILLLDV